MDGNCTTVLVNDDMIIESSLMKFRKCHDCVRRFTRLIDRSNQILEQISNTFCNFQH